MLFTVPWIDIKKWLTSSDVRYRRLHGSCNKIFSCSEQVSKQEMLTVKCCLNLQFTANIRRIQICFLTDRDEWNAREFLSGGFSRQIVNRVWHFMREAWSFAYRSHGSFCHVHAIVRIVQWEENSEMRLAYLHIFVRRGRWSNTHIWFLIQEDQNIAVYGDKCWKRWNFSGV